MCVLLYFLYQQFKAQGNAALQAGKLAEASDLYTQAINLDGSNHVYYSNRSAAYLKMGNATNALEDAEACIGLNPAFPKGYSRKGAALHALKRYNDSIEAYELGLSKFPGDAGLTNGLADAKRDKDSSTGGFGGGAGSPFGGGPGGGLFNPSMMAKLATDPKLQPFLNDPDIMGKVKMMQSNPNLLPTMLSDPKMMDFLSMMMGGMQEAPAGSEPPDAEADDGIPDMGFSPSATPTEQSEPKAQVAKAPEPEPEPMEEEEDLSNLSPEERKKKEDQKLSVEAKTNGNDLYKKKKFKEALAAYDEAIALDGTNMTFYNNKAAVYFTQKLYDDCISMCEKAVEVGKANMAPFEDRAKALTRCAKAYQKKGDLGKAIEMCKEAQLEAYQKETQRLLKTLELEKRKADTQAYQSDEKAEEAKQRGNEHFRNKQWGDAVKEYEEAVKRAPKNATIRNNLSAALCKIMDFNGAKREIEKAVELDPSYVKAWARKGDIEVMMKENHKAMESYRKGLELDSDNATCKEGLRKINSMMSSTMTEDERKERAAHAMADPEIQAILNDPVIRQILKDFAENPTAAQQAMLDPVVRAKIEKLIASGVVEAR